MTPLTFSYIVLLVVQVIVGLTAIRPFFRIFFNKNKALDFFRVAVAGVAVSSVLGLIFNIYSGVTSFTVWSWTQVFMCFVRVVAWLFLGYVIFLTDRKIKT